jgi:hypothetical protein
VALLKKKLEAGDVGSNLEELVSILEYIPLAVVQAAAYIQKKGSKYGVRQYMDDFQKSEKRQTNLPNYEAGHLRQVSEAQNAIIITWQISFNSIRQQWRSSADLLSLTSFFDRQGIPKEVLIVQISEDRRGERGRDDNQERNQDYHEDGAFKSSDSDADAEDDASDQFEDDIDRLQNYSVVFDTANEHTFEMQELVQLATRKWLAMQR